MIRNMIQFAIPTIFVAALGSCIPATEQPAAAQSPTPSGVAPASADAAAPMPATATTTLPPADPNWMDAPQTPGDWRYGADPDETLAIFGLSESENVVPLIIRCGVAEREVWIGRRGVGLQAGEMRISTETGTRTLQAQPIERTTVVAARLNAKDPLLDAIALSKGRFAVELAGAPTLYVPAWPEITRAIEDCRYEGPPRGRRPED